MKVSESTRYSNSVSELDSMATRYISCSCSSCCWRALRGVISIIVRWMTASPSSVRPTIMLVPSSQWDRAVAPARAVFPVLAVPHLVQQQVGLPQHDAVLLQHRAEHAAVPVAQALLHASVSQQGERRPVEGDQVARPAFAANEADDPAGDGVVDAGEQRGLLPRRWESSSAWVTSR